MTQILIKEHGCIGKGPWEVDILPEAFRSGDAVLKGTLVEHVGRELGEAGMHPVLDLQADRPVREKDEPFEKRLGKSGSCGFLVHDDGPELL